MSNMTSRFETFNKRMLQITREIQRLRIKHMKKYGLSGIHLGCMIALNRCKELTVKELMDIEVVDKAQISRALKALVAKGFIMVSPGQEGIYKVKYSLTGSGKILAGELNEITSGFVERAVTGVSTEEIEIMYNTLDKILNNLFIANKES